MSALFKLSELDEIIGGEWIIPFSEDGEFMIASDNRLNCEKRVFIALVGALFDAHKVLDQVAGQGAAALIVNQKANIDFSSFSLPILAVEDTLLAYQQLARHYRRSIPELKLIAVTGSVGKTSTKEMLRAIGVAAFGAELVYATSGNTNNQFGVPQNLFLMPADCRYAVIEMGTNHFGEIAPLSYCAEPTTSLVSSIAACHLEFLGSLEGVAREKSEIFSYLKPDGCAVIPMYSPGIEILRNATVKFRHYSFGDEIELLDLPLESDAGRVVAKVISSDLACSEMELIFIDNTGIIFKKSLLLPIGGTHQCRNAAAAAAAAWSSGIEPDTICRGLEATTLPGSRMKIINYAEATWINDAYNANPQSMAAALRYLKNLKLILPPILVLGDMLELGGGAVAMHCELLREAVESFPDSKLILVGEIMQQAVKAAELKDNQNITVVSSGEIAEALLLAQDISNRTILIKSSNGIGLSKLPSQKN